MIMVALPVQVFKRAKKIKNVLLMCISSKNNTCSSKALYIDLLYLVYCECLIILLYIVHYNYILCTKYHHSIERSNLMNMVIVSTRLKASQ